MLAAPGVSRQSPAHSRWMTLSARTGWETLDWPMTSYQLAGQPLATGRGSGALIGDGPSFVRFAEAVASFFCFKLGLGGSVDSMSPALQQQDLAGRISTVRLDSAEVSVGLEGRVLEGMTVELASTEPGPSQVLSAAQNQTVRFPLSGALPPGAWIVLKCGSEWIDRKFINYPNTLNPDPGVEIAVEPMTEVMALVSGGEGATVEFKGILPPSGSELRERVCRTVAAFANGDGGHVLFGVEDDGVVVGIGAVDAQETCDTVARFVSSIVTPVPEFRVDGVTVAVDDDGSALVVVLTVEEGGQPPYGVNPANPRYYIRRGATTFPASSDQVRTLARSRPPADGRMGGVSGCLACRQAPRGRATCTSPNGSRRRAAEPAEIRPAGHDQHSRLHQESATSSAVFHRYSKPPADGPRRRTPGARWSPPMNMRWGRPGVPALSCGPDAGRTGTSEIRRGATDSEREGRSNRHRRDHAADTCLDRRGREPRYGLAG